MNVMVFLSFFFSLFSNEQKYFRGNTSNNAFIGLESEKKSNFFAEKSMQNVQKLKIIFKKFKINNSGRNAFKLVSLNSGQYV